MNDYSREMAGTYLEGNVIPQLDLCLFGNKKRSVPPYYAVCVRNYLNEKFPEWTRRRGTN